MPARSSLWHRATSKQLDQCRPHLWQSLTFAQRRSRPLPPGSPKGRLHCHELPHQSAPSRPYDHLIHLAPTPRAEATRAITAPPRLRALTQQDLWDALALGWRDFGALVILSAPYAGNVAALGPATPGYVAETSTIAAGAWDFDDAVTLQPNTQYWFLMASGVPAALLFGGDLYPGGIAYQTDSRGDFVQLATFDLNFSLQGTPITATPEPASALLLAPALLGLLRNRRTTR